MQSENGLQVTKQKALEYAIDEITEYFKDRWEIYWPEGDYSFENYIMDNYSYDWQVLQQLKEMLKELDNE